MKRVILILLALFALAGPAAANIPGPGPDPNSPEHWYDREGTRYFCLDIDPDLGCLYRVDNRDNDFVLYWVGNDGIRRSYVVPKSGWGFGDPDLAFSAVPSGGYWEILWYRRTSPAWTPLGYYYQTDPNAPASDPYPCCPDGSC